MFENRAGQVYYNESDPYPAQWLRNLIIANRIAPGYVDQRDIKEVTANDLRGYNQCHFFAGIGTWSYAFRSAGWPDDRPVWTGSPPCQPFSTAGLRRGADDPRHLWPEWFRLIHELRPATIFAEQVSSKDGLAWLDIVSADLESEGYAVGAFDLCAAGAGAFHIRQRLYVVAHTESSQGGLPVPERESQRESAELVGSSEVSELALTAGRGAPAGEQPGRLCGFEQGGEADLLGDAQINGIRPFDGQSRESRKQQEQVGGSGISGELGDADGGRRESGNSKEWAIPITDQAGDFWAGSMADTGSTGLAGRESQRRDNGEEQPSAERTGGFWDDVEWLYCRDGKYRPTKPGLQPVVDGYPGRVAELRAVGNAIVAPLAAEFIRSYMETET